MNGGNVSERIVKLEGAALKRICEEIYELPKQPNEFTAAEVSEQTGINYKTVQSRLNKMVKENILDCRMGHSENGYNAKLYKYIEKQDENQK